MARTCRVPRHCRHRPDLPLTSMQSACRLVQASCDRSALRCRRGETTCLPQCRTHRRWLRPPASRSHTTQGEVQTPDPLNALDRREVQTTRRVECRAEPGGQDYPSSHPTERAGGPDHRLRIAITLGKPLQRRGSGARSGQRAEGHLRYLLILKTIFNMVHFSSGGFIGCPVPGSQWSASGGEQPSSRRETRGSGASYAPDLDRHPQNQRAHPRSHGGRSHPISVARVP